MSISKLQYKVLIPTSGVGAELGDIPKYINKTLIKVGKKPTLSYIIESYPEDTEYFITLGHFGDQVRQFIELVYPDRKFTFVPVDIYEGEGSSLAYSLLQARDLLQTPFVYHASDTILTNNVPYPSHDWLGGVRGSGSAHYGSFDTMNGKVQQVYDKGHFDAEFLYIGVAGINDYEQFWQHLSGLQAKDSRNTSLGDMAAIRAMITAGQTFMVNAFKQWYDVGNIDSLQAVRKEIEDSFHILDKLEESIYLFPDSVVKFFSDEKITAERVARADVLKGLVPKLEGATTNFYRYAYADGDLYANVANKTNFREFLQWSKKNLWKPVQEVSDEEFQKVCHDFYYTKTKKRVEDLFETRLIKDEETIINDQKIPSLQTMLKQIDFNWLSAATQTGFHGDFILDNIIKTENGFTLLDWRHNFGGLTKAGDMYYDLAKLNHNLTINHDIVNDNQFTIRVTDKEVSCDIMRRQNLVECQDELFRFIKEQSLDEKKVRVLTALVWLNMSPLHHHPLDIFLFYFGKYNLWQVLGE